MSRINHSLGQIFELRRKFTLEDVENFARLTGDNNPIHLDANYAKKSLFQERVVHGALTNSLFSTIFATIFPGPGGIYLSQSSKFIKPVFLNQEIIAKAQLLEVTDKNIALFSTKCFDNDDNLLLAGEAKILLA